MPRIAALIVAAGRGERLGSALPKQFLPLHGVPMLRRSVAAFADREDVSQTAVVIGAGQENGAERMLGGSRCLPPVLGGETRQDSVRHGLEALEPHAPDLVLIHDAARPFASAALIGRVIDALGSGIDAAIPLLPLADTLKHREPDGTWSTRPRDALFRAQTPQGFRFAAILKAHRELALSEVTDDMALAEAAGLSIAPVAGEEINMKITTSGDFEFAEKILAGSMNEFRTGYGFDVHRFVPGDHVWLCGVRVAHDRSLEGHSDADAGLHALTDALLGAIGAGDIGVHFPPTDEQWRSASSAQFLDHAAELIHRAGGAIVHCDVTLVCERPKVSPHREAMRARIAEILDIDVSRVSVKATTTERMGFTGRGEGLAAHAVATIRLPAP